MVVEVSGGDLSQPFPLYGDRLIHALAQSLLDGLQLRLHTITSRFPFNLEFAPTGLAADEGKAQEVEGLSPTQTKKNEDSSVNASHIFGIKIADVLPQLVSWHCRDLVNHESRTDIETIAFVSNDWNPKQWRCSWVGGRDADRNGFSCIKTIALQNNCRSRFARVILAAGNGPYFSALQLITWW
jgi:hypothetical protein